jgi:HSP20 family protein
MQPELNDLLRETFGPNPFGVGFDPERWERWMPLANLSIRGDQWVVRVELPEVAPNAVSLSVVGNQLLIQGERRQPEKFKAEEFIFQECPYGPFERVITLPDAIPENQVHAIFEQGVLYITLPATGRKGKKIEIHPENPTRDLSEAA